MSLEKKQVTVYDALKASYKKPKKQEQDLLRFGYVRDSKLSNGNQQIYYNPTTKKVLNTVTGTHNLRDWGTDILLTAGRLKDTNRYNQAKKTLDKAKQKYHTNNVDIAGHSLGGSIAQYISSKNDKVRTIDAGTTIGQKSRSNQKNYRTNGDLVSLLAANQKHTINLSNNKNSSILTNGIISNAFNAHNLDNFKGDKLYF